MRFMYNPRKNTGGKKNTQTRKFGSILTKTLNGDLRDTIGQISNIRHGRLSLRYKITYSIF